MIKNIYLNLLVLLVVLFSLSVSGQSYNRFNQPVLINNTLKVGSSTANSSGAQMEVVSTSKGSIACPKMTLAQMASIASPTAGLCVYATDATKNKARVYDGSTWNAVITNPGTDNISISTNTISTTNTNGDLNLSPNGSGTVVINTDLDVDNINLNGNTVSSTDTNGNLNLEPNGSGMVKSTKNVALSSTLAVGQTTAAHSSAVFEAVSTSKGSVACPKMTVAQRDSIAAPTSGLCVYNTDTNRLNYYDNAQWSEVGSGTGGGGINFIENDGAEANATGWTTYDDGAAIPVDGSGGTPSVMWDRTTSDPLSGTASFLFTKGSGVTQGQGVAYPFTIDPQHQGETQRISFYYQPASGTYADGDLTVYIIHPDTGRVIQPSGFEIENVGIPTKKSNIEFQTLVGDLDYVLVIHVASTTSSAFTVKFDSFEVGPNNYARGTPVTDWKPYTPTFDGFGTPTNVLFEYSQSGQDLLIRGNFTTGTTTGTEARVSLPPGLTSKSDISTIGIVGTMALSYTGANSSYVLVEPSKSYITFGVQSGSQAALTKANGNTFTSSSAHSITARIPIQGWSSNVQMSDSADTRVVDFVGYVSTDQALTGGTTNLPLTAIKDSHSVWTGSTYPVPVPGDYFVQFTNTLLTSSSQSFSIYVNGSSVGILGTLSSSTRSSLGKLVPDLKAGDIVSIRADGNITVDGDSTATSAPQLSIFKLSGPSQIAASESVSASYYRTSSQSLTANTTILDFDTKEWDSHGAVTTGSSWKFTAPVNGEYEVILLGLSGNNSSFRLRKNGTAYKLIGGSTTAGQAHPGVVRVKLLAGEYIDVISTASISIGGGSAPIESHISIARVGNY